jgi:SAM-dependent methyltransferase
MSNWLKLLFDLRYRFGRPPWDSGITPPEVVAFVTSIHARGRALDVGCGTGTNSIYLAHQGYSVVGVDFSTKAISLAQSKAQQLGLAIDFKVADVTKLDFLHDPFDYILDIGCLHTLDESGRVEYAAHLARLAKPGGTFMLYAFSPRPGNERGHQIRARSAGIPESAVTRLFASNFSTERVEHGDDHGARASAWYWFKRK